MLLKGAVNEIEESGGSFSDNYYLVLKISPSEAVRDVRLREFRDGWSLYCGCEAHYTLERN